MRDAARARKMKSGFTPYRMRRALPNVQPVTNVTGKQTKNQTHPQMAEGLKAKEVSAK